MKVELAWFWWAPLSESILDPKMSENVRCRKMTLIKTTLWIWRRSFRGGIVALIGILLRAFSRWGMMDTISGTMDSGKVKDSPQWELWKNVASAKTWSFFFLKERLGCPAQWLTWRYSDLSWCCWNPSLWMCGIPYQDIAMERLSIRNTKKLRMLPLHVYSHSVIEMCKYVFWRSVNVCNWFTLAHMSPLSRRIQISNKHLY